MNVHKNARLTPRRREEMALCVIEGRLTKARAARVYGVSAKIVTRWAELWQSVGQVCDLFTDVECDNFFEAAEYRAN